MAVSVAEAVEEAVAARIEEGAFEDALHPRDRLGKWIAAIGKLEPGGKLRVGTAGSVQKVQFFDEEGIKHKVRGGGKPDAWHSTPEAAARDLMARVGEGKPDEPATDFEAQMAGLSDAPTGDAWPSPRRRQGLLKAREAADRALLGHPVDENERAALTWWHREGKQKLSADERQWLQEFQITGSSPATKRMVAGAPLPHPSSVARAGHGPSPRPAPAMGAPTTANVGAALRKGGFVAAKKRVSAGRPGGHGIPGGNYPTVTKPGFRASKETEYRQKKHEPTGRVKVEWAGTTREAAADRTAQVEAMAAHLRAQGFAVTVDQFGAVIVSPGEVKKRNIKETSMGSIGECVAAVVEAGFEESLHPRGRGGKWIGKDGGVIGMGDFIEHAATGERGIASLHEGGKVALHPRGESYGSGKHVGPAADFRVISRNPYAAKPITTQDAERRNAAKGPSQYSIASGGHPDRREHYDNEPKEAGMVGRRMIGVSFGKNGSVSAKYHHANGGMKDLGTFPSHPAAHKAIVGAHERYAQSKRKVKESEDEMGIAERVAAVVEGAFEEALHPRDRRGEFAAILGKLKVGERTSLGRRSGVSVARVGASEWRVHKKLGPPGQQKPAKGAGLPFSSATAAAGHALSLHNKHFSDYPGEAAGLPPGAPRGSTIASKADLASKAGHAGAPGPAVSKHGDYSVHVERTTTHTSSGVRHGYSYAVHQKDGQHLTSHGTLEDAQAAAKGRDERKKAKGDSGKGPLHETYSFGGVPTKLGDIIGTLQKEGHSQQHIDRYVQGLKAGQPAPSVIKSHGLPGFKGVPGAVEDKNMNPANRAGNETGILKKHNVKMSSKTAFGSPISYSVRATGPDEAKRLAEKQFPNHKAKSARQVKESVGEAVERAVTEAADSLAKASTPEPFSTSKTSNWIARSGGLPPYIQHIAHDLMEKRGKTESNAIQMAIGIVRNWASGQGKVDANTRAAASKAVAEFEAKRAKAKAT